MSDSLDGINNPMFRRCVISWYAKSVKLFKVIPISSTELPVTRSVKLHSYWCLKKNCFHVKVIYHLQRVALLTKYTCLLNTNIYGHFSINICVLQAHPQTCNKQNKLQPIDRSEKIPHIFWRWNLSLSIAAQQQCQWRLQNRRKASIPCLPECFSQYRKLPWEMTVQLCTLSQQGNCDHRKCTEITGDVAVRKNSSRRKETHSFLQHMLLPQNNFHKTKNQITHCAGIYDIWGLKNNCTEIFIHTILVHQYRCVPVWWGMDFLTTSWFPYSTLEKQK